MTILVVIPEHREGIVGNVGGVITVVRYKTVPDEILTYETWDEIPRRKLFDATLVVDVTRGLFLKNKYLKPKQSK